MEDSIQSSSEDLCVSVKLFDKMYKTTFGSLTPWTWL